jgi:alginate O-acetyltransferase complex protein AlgI
MFGMSQDAEPALTTLAIIKVSVIITLMVIAHWLMRNSSVLQLALKIPWWFLAIVWALMLMALALSQESSSSFIYFQF